VIEGARVLLLPSFDEGFGLTALEAMTLGVAVVASDRGALPELLDGAGLLVDPDEPEALAAALQRLLDEPGLVRALSERGRQRAAEFSWERTARLTRAVYDAAVDRHRAKHPEHAGAAGKTASGGSTRRPPTTPPIADDH
jgi:glycosyltransferase involved in cell wall biosynthesis